MTITRNFLVAALATAMLTAAATPAYAPEGDGRDRHVVLAGSATCDPLASHRSS